MTLSHFSDDLSPYTSLSPSHHLFFPLFFFSPLSLILSFSISTPLSLSIYLTFFFFSLQPSMSLLSSLVFNCHDLCFCLLEPVSRCKSRRYSKQRKKVFQFNLILGIPLFLLLSSIKVEKDCLYLNNLKLSLKIIKRKI